MSETKITLHSNNFDVAILTPSQGTTTLQLVMAHAICLISFLRDHSLDSFESFVFEIIFRLAINILNLITVVKFGIFGKFPSIS